MTHYAPAVCIVIAFIVGVLVIRTGSEIFGLILLVSVFGCVAFLAWNNRAKIAVWWHRKLTEWRNDARQLGLWLKLALTRNRTPHATATMAHQQQFLTGRMMDPVNLIMIASVAVIALPLVGGFQEWRINRVKKERDAACSERELTANRRGDYQTSRAACAALAETARSAREWRTRAITSESALVRHIATARLEGEQSLQREATRRQRTEASLIRQRRRDNEGLSSALGGGAPDLERSLCELAGRLDCATTGSSTDDAAATGPVSVPSGSGDANTGTDPSASR